MDSTTPAQVLRQVRMVGRYGWLGGYDHAVLLDDSCLLGPECVKPNYREISWATRHRQDNGWRAVAVVALDGTDDTDCCAECGKVLQ